MPLSNRPTINVTNMNKPSNAHNTMVIPTSAGRTQQVSLRATPMVSLPHQPVNFGAFTTAAGSKIAQAAMPIKIAQKVSGTPDLHVKPALIKGAAANRDDLFPSHTAQQTPNLSLIKPPAAADERLSPPMFLDNLASPSSLE